MVNGRSRTGRVVAIAIVVAAALVAGVLAWEANAAQKPGFVSWPTARAAAEGLDADALETFADSLMARQTKALIVARHGSIVLERYAPDFSASRRHYISAMAKGTAGAPTLIAAADVGALSLDEKLSDLVPEWKNDPWHAAITIHELAFHASGMQDVDFSAGEAGELPGWEQYYYDHPDARFRMALDSAQLLYEPGTRFNYSGVGFYALSYAVTRALHRSDPNANIPAFIDSTVYRPIGLPPESWSLGYGRSDTIDGMALTHFGSGGELTARAAARIGQLLLQRGCWAGRRVLDADRVDTMLGRNGVTSRPSGPDASPDDEPGPAAGGGWWINVGGTWPSAPRYAAAAIGGGHEILWLDPELDLVAVRFGENLSDPGESFQDGLERHFVSPLYQALRDAKSVPTSGPKEVPGSAACSGES